MDKIPFQISAVKSGEVARVRIVGTIGWETDAEAFRAQVDAIANDGVRDVHVYINSPGGSCFDAAEIVNILSVFKGDISGEGGALVASAATYIALHCKTFSMPDNGMFMIHKPSGSVGGTSGEIKNYLKMLEDIEGQYYDAYKALAKSPDTLAEKWQSGDWWMTAKEAMEQGFVSSVHEKTKINRETASAIKACGCPFEIEITDYKPQKKENEMDLKTTAILLGLPETATETEVNAKLEANKKAAAELEAFKAAQAQKEKTEERAKIKALLDKAIVDKRIKADSRAEWEDMLGRSFEVTSKILESIAPAVKLSGVIVTSAEGKKTYRGKTFAQLQDEDPGALAELEKEDAEAFRELFNESFGKGDRK